MENNAKDQASSARIFSSTLNVTEGCKNGAPPPCTAACPYGLDVRELMRRLQRGSFRGANNFLAEQLLFPQTMCAICGAPCMEACGQELGGAAIRLPLLERAAFAFSGKKRPTVFRVPPKQEKVAVVGGGLSGLCCAYALASLGYPVTVFDKRAKLGGRLNELLPEEAFLPELTQALALPNVELCLEHLVEDLEELTAFQGILIATGAGGDSFGLEDGGQRPGVFAAGELTGAALPGTVQSGKQAAAALDAYLKTGAVSGLEQTPCTTAQAADAKPTPLAEALDKAQAQDEAARCRRCDCTHCYDACDLLQYYKTTPQKLEADVRVTLNPVDRFMARRATRLISSCNDCGLCGDVCPEQIDLRALLMESRTVMNQEGSIPPAYHDFWLRDMAFSTGESTVYLSAPSNGYLFFPGCQLGASDPDYVKQAYAILQDILPGTGLLLNCCGVPAKWAGERELFRAHLTQLKAVWEEHGKPRFITACPTCRKTLNEDLPEMEAVSLYTLLAERFTPAPSAGGESAALFHPCSSRGDPEEQESVQELLRRCGLRPESLGDAAGCCGFGGHIYPANPELFDAVAEKRTSASPLPYVTYCANCRDVFAAKGKDCRHILDILSNTDHRDRPLPTLQQRRENRVILKAHFSGEPVGTEEHMKLIISDELRQRLDRMLILDEDVEAVIRRCVSEQRFLKTEDGQCIGHLKQGTLTYWAVWRCAEDAYQVLNVYSHRMSIEGE